MEVDEVKHFYTDLINKDDKEKLHVFNENGLYFATKKIGKNNPKAEQIQTDNRYRMRWNCKVDRAIVSGVAETEIQPQMPVQEPVRQPAEKETLAKPKIPPKPVMSAEAVAYPKLFKIYKELKRQNQIIFEAEKELNALKFERDDLKGLARFPQKGELQSKIDRKNKEIDILKVGLSGIVKRYGYQNVQKFYRIYHKSHSVHAKYREQVAEWKKTYG